MDTWYVEQDVTTLGTPGSPECLFNPCMTLLSHPAIKACLENSQVAPKAMSSLGLLGGRKNVGKLLEIAFQSEKLREICTLGLPQKQAWK